MTPDITLQINLSAGDAAYAELTVPALVRAHADAVSHRMAVVDCCRPQRTKVIDPDKRFPEPEFSRRVERIRAIAASLQAAGWLDEVVYLEPGDPLFGDLSRRYLRGLVTETHDYVGCALMSYLAGFELPRTRFVLHYDADMLLYQAPGYDWSADAAALMLDARGAVAATPRISPPFAHLMTGAADGPSAHEGLPNVPVRGGWRSTWFSTRAMLIDKQQLARFLPLMSGRVLLEVLAVKYLNRGYPRSPEIMLFRRLRHSGGWRLNLATTNAWLLHPESKPPKYLEMLPRIQQCVASGVCPVEQAGRTEIDVAAWERFLADDAAFASAAGRAARFGDEGIAPRPA